MVKKKTIGYLDINKQQVILIQKNNRLYLDKNNRLS